MKNIFAAAMLAASLLTSFRVAAVEIAADAYPMPVPASQKAGTKMEVTVIDNRPYVLDGESAESYEGMTRELYGIPISRNTADRSPMATYLGERLRIGFANAGYAATFQASPKGSEPAARAAAMANSGNDLLFVVNLREWSYDQGFAHPEFTHDVTVDVYDGAGSLLSTYDSKGVDPMPTGGWKHYKKRYAELYQKIFERIFASPPVVQGLAGVQTIEAKPGTAGPTLEARLSRLRELRQQGLIDEASFREQETRILSGL